MPNTPNKGSGPSWLFRIGAFAFFFLVALAFIASMKGPSHTAVDPSTIVVPVDVSGSMQSAKSSPQTLPAEPEQEQVQEPQKTVPELVAQADAQLAKHDFEGAAGSLKDALDLVNIRSRDAIPLLLKHADASFASSESDDTARSSYLQALANLDRAYGPQDVRVLPALRGLIATYDDTGDHDKALLLTQRYQSIASGASESEFPPTADDEATAAKLIEAAQQRVKDDPSLNLADQIDEATGNASKEQGSDSYVVALLALKRAELADANDGASVDASSGDTLRTILSLIEHRFGPLDARNEPALRRLIALKDGEGDFEAAQTLTARLSALNHAAK